jgi:hypothetical protein
MELGEVWSGYYWLVIEPRLAPKYLRKIHGIKYSSPPPHTPPFVQAFVKNRRLDRLGLIYLSDCCDHGG